MRLFNPFTIWLLISLASCGGGPGAGDPDAATDSDEDSGTDTEPDGGPDTESDTSLATSCVVFVNGSLAEYSGHDGSAWELAYGTVQEGIDLASELVETSNCDNPEVWVVEGTYLPTADVTGDADPADQRTKTILMRIGVFIYGGFEGNENARVDREISEHETVLSGDIGVDQDSSDNAYHVVTGADGANIDGFTITNGNANGESDETARGGGMYNDSASPTVSNCLFVENLARDGAGMANIDSSPRVTDSTFSNNFTTCSFDGDPYGSGGGMFNWDSSPLVTRCVFSENMGSSGGGGMMNTASDWWAVGSSPVVTSCVFEGNSTTLLPADYGATSGGGMFNFINSSPTLTNCVFARNVSNEGGNVASVANCEPLFVNCTFLAGTANTGDCMRSASQSCATVKNCIVWGENDGQPYDAFASTPNSEFIVTNSDVQGGYGGAGNINEDPFFVDVDPLAAEVDLHLSAGSPCGDSGLTTALPADTPDLDQDGDTTEPVPHDLDGNDRVVGSSVDMGAFECL